MPSCFKLNIQKCSVDSIFINYIRFLYIMRALVFLYLLFSNAVFSQIGTGEWRLHVPTRQAIDVATIDSFVYTAYESGIMEYNIHTNEKFMLNKVNILSDIQLSCLDSDTTNKTVYVGYNNGNIDKIKNGSVLNIPAIKLAQIAGSKKINMFYIQEEYIYVATDFSIVVLDKAKDEVKDTYYPTNSLSPILDILIVGDTIYSLTTNKLQKASLLNPAISDPSQWINETRLPELISIDQSYKEIEQVAQDIYVLFALSDYGMDSVFKLNQTGYELLTNYPYSIEIRTIKNRNNDLYVCADGAILTYDQSGIPYSNYLSLYLNIWFKPNAIDFLAPDIWVADGDKSGLIRIIGNYSYLEVPILGPPKNQFYSMDGYNGSIAIASGTLNGIAPSFSISGAYVFKDEQWSLKDKSNIPNWDTITIHDFLGVSINPTNTDQMALCSYSPNPLTLVSVSGDEAQTYNQSNSIIENTYLNNGWSLCSDVCYDDNGRLWVLNGYTQEPLKVLDENNAWHSFDAGANSRNKFSSKMVVDYNNNIWFVMRSQGFFGYDFGSDVSDKSDDRYKQFTASVNNGNLPSNEVTALAVDFQNEIWVGTESGFAILYNSDASLDAASGDFELQRIKVEYEGNVEYVLGDTWITDIEVDGGNRKWMATASAGIVLLSSDGSTIIEQHTTDNSPIISNVIYDLQLNHKTGELFIVTDKGLMSYRTNATYEDPNYSTVKVFPNPVRPNFNGLITIQGIRYDSDVKITDVAGNLVYKTTSNGGTASWNGQTLDGQKVATGVYLIWTAAKTGAGRKVGKVLVIN